MRTAIWWLRRDLRLADNPALQRALQAAEQALPAFILDPALLRSRYVGEKRLAFLYACLAELDGELRRRGSYLVVRQGEPVEVLQRLRQETGAEAIFAEQDISPYAARRDRRVERSLPVEWVGLPMVHPPQALYKADGKPYTIFTPFSKAWKALPFPSYTATPPPERIPTPPDVPSLPIPAPGAALIFEPGESAALRRLAQFSQGAQAAIYRYGEWRNRLDVEGTSGLSPYLRFGVLSARRAAAAAYAAIQAAPDAQARQSAETWLNELIWREFYQYILYHFPHARRESFRADLRHIRWENDPRRFDAWRTGQTGYPLIDAAMRQLVQTGWMHNRARMVVASFLTKDLLVDWRWGEQWFMQHLVDGDPAANNGGWQWTAGTGTDAAPYFRIFNPVTQSARFDPQGEYIRRWTPELGAVPPEYIHAPWQMPIEAQRAAGCIIGRDYPAPIVDHRLARQKALALYAGAKDG